MAGDASSTETPSLVQGLCPDGWYIPGWEEWDLLFDDILAASETGMAGDNLLLAFGIDPENSELAGSGMRDESGTFEGLGVYAGFWASTHTSINSAWYASLNLTQGAWLSRLDSSRSHGRSIRCFKNP